MSLPLVMVFERHWDMAPKSLLLDIIPKLANEGYNTFCVEASPHLTQEEFLERNAYCITEDSSILTQAESALKRHIQIKGKISDIHFSDLRNLMQSYVSSKFFHEVAVKIKMLPSSILFKSVLDTAIKHQFFIKGVDDAESIESITALPDSKDRHDLIDETNEKRNEAIASNLYALKSRQKQIVFSCGAFHFNDVVAKLKKKGLKDDDLICYFPHSLEQWDVTNEEMIGLATCAPANQTCCLSSPTQIKAFGERIIKEIKSKSYSVEVPGRNSHTDFLTEFFKVSFKTFVWPNYHADAQTSSLQIANQLKRLQIPHHIQNDKLVIPNINTQEVAQSIRLLPYLA